MKPSFNANDSYSIMLVYITVIATATVAVIASVDYYALAALMALPGHP